MIEINEAIRRLNKIPLNRDSEVLEISNALNRVLSQDVISLICMPPFDQSAMDGYVILQNIDEDITKKPYELVGEIKAGDDASQFSLRENQAIRIFTGAMVPKNATTVIPQELVQAEEQYTA